MNKSEQEEVEISWFWANLLFECSFNIFFFQKKAKQTNLQMYQCKVCKNYCCIKKSFWTIVIVLILIKTT